MKVLLWTSALAACAAGFAPRAIAQGSAPADANQARSASRAPAAAEDPMKEES